ncbi:linoleate 13S-lipoxygenase 3-1, chloroplastic-like protein [Tanacetum coccineum]|uniref:Linoleate 13S-lipoxygenase 3-1, chloroplastic-like protein n=1 Tax=Tanacetum coccineum TaxID=301880 RepID=A0ABQ5E938_9ASTR
MTLGCPQNGRAGVPGQKGFGATCLPKLLPVHRLKRFLTSVQYNATALDIGSLAKAHVCSGYEHIISLMQMLVIEQALPLPLLHGNKRCCYKHGASIQKASLADLIQRAVPDPSQKTTSKLLIEDYPYASEAFNMGSNTKLDMSYENWWPTLANAEDLTAILTTIIWLALAQHATLNFGQYPYGGYIPKRPPRMRRLISCENDPKYTTSLKTSKLTFFALRVCTVDKRNGSCGYMSTHSPDEEYIGERQQRDTWSGDAEMVEAFYGFASEIQRIEKEIEKQNCDLNLKNRCGAGVLPYELLAPSSEPGVTCRVIPNSVSI